MQIHVSKLDAAKRQLETAMNLFFRGGDPVAIHTLANAAQEVLEDISIKQGFSSIRKDVLAMAREDKRAELEQKLTAPKNFFKHADRDPDGIVKFNPESTAFDIWDAGRMYYILTQDNIPLFRVFDIWFYSRHPDVINLESSLKEQIDQALIGLKLNPENRGSFLTLLPIVESASYKFN